MLKILNFLILTVFLLKINVSLGYMNANRVRGYKYIDSRHDQNYHANKENYYTCKYYLIEQTFFTKFTSSLTSSIAQQSSYLNSLFMLDQTDIELNELYFKTIITSNCLNKTDLVLIRKLIDETNSLIYGIDLSFNNLNDTQFNFIISYQYQFLNKKLTNVRSLNLTGNSLTYFNHTEFTDLEVLILDRNLKIETLSLINKRFKILSLNKCNLNEKFNRESKISFKITSSYLIYLGLNDNKLNDLTLNSEELIFTLVKALVPSQIDYLDLSLNKLNKIETLIFLLRQSSIKKLNLEKNLFSLFNVNELIDIKSMILEINLRFNFIRSTNLEYYQLNQSFAELDSRLSVKLYGNPLVCDCDSMWLFDEIGSMTRKFSKSNELQLNKRKKFKSLQNKEPSNEIKLIFKRDLEEISDHFGFDSSSQDSYMLRQKRIKNKQNIIRIIDFNLLTCNFIDVQNFSPNNNLKSIFNDTIDQFGNENYDYSEIYDERTNLDLFQLDYDLRKQNFLVNNVKYREKLIINSNYEDYMCLYEDHCRPSDCDCCGFRHCHCRSICPRQCRCYFDNKLNKNIIDCSSLNMIDVPNQPIESATDIRLNSNSLKILKSHSFFGFGKLKFLYLQNNQISYITADAFEDLKYSLKLLNLANNRLMYLTGDEFIDLDELNVLILNKNPLKDIDNYKFLMLQNLRFIFLAETNLPNNKLIDMEQYARKFTNSSLKYKLKDFKQFKKTTKSLYFIDTDDRTLIKLNNATEMQTYNGTSFLLQFKIFNSYYLSSLIFVSVVVLSLVIVLVIVLVVRKFDSTDRFKRNKRRVCLCFASKNEFNSNCSSNLYENDDDLDTTRSMTNKCDCLVRINNLRASNSFDSFDCYDSKFIDNDMTVSVPVSRSIENLSLNVFIYFNMVDNEYVQSYLLPILKKCLLIIPDTKFITKPQHGLYITLAPDSVLNMTNYSTTLTTRNSSNTTLPNNKVSNSLTANILILSENFYGYKTMADSLVSLKIKSSQLNPAHLANNNSIYNMKTKCYRTSNLNGSSVESNFKSAFRIFINTEPMGKFKEKCEYYSNSSSSTSSAGKMYSLNQKLMRRLYDTSNRNKPSSILNNDRLSFHLYNNNDLLSSYAYNDRLQFKLEKFLENICLKYLSFSNTNFSYVDYTKR